MKHGWFERLIKAIQRKGGSMRSLSISAGFGPNYVSQMINDRKEPGTDKVAALLDVLGEEEAAYVLLGVRLNRQELVTLERLSNLDPKSRELFEGFLETLEENKGTQ